MSDFDDAALERATIAAGSICQDAIRRAVAREREACAVIAEKWKLQPNAYLASTAKVIADAIRARSAK